MSASLRRNFWLKKLVSPYSLWLPISILAASCATTEKTGEPPKPTHYVLEEGPISVASLPFPNQHSIYVKIYAGEVMLERKLAYRGFDVDHDGLIDMIEYLSDNGEVVRTSYKFTDHDAVSAPSH